MSAHVCPTNFRSYGWDQPRPLFLFLSLLSWSHLLRKERTTKKLVGYAIKVMSQTLKSLKCLLFNSSIAIDFSFIFNFLCSQKRSACVYRELREKRELTVNFPKLSCIVQFKLSILPVGLISSWSAPIPIAKVKHLEPCEEKGGGEMSLLLLGAFYCDGYHCPHYSVPRSKILGNSQKLKTQNYQL